MRLTVIIPTYNEVLRIGSLLREILGITANTVPHDWHVVVVDGNSPDGTGRAVEAVMLDHENVYLITEEGKRGIAMAYVTGMRHAIDVLRTDAFIEFDGDGQHDPNDLPRLVEALEEGAEYVIGSRYVEGGSVPREWARYRKLLSSFGSLYARLLLDLPVFDATSGFKATKVGKLTDALPLSEDALLSRNYAYKLQFLQVAVRSGATIREIPIMFRMRDHDISKSAWYDILESLWVTGQLRVRTLHEWRFLRVIAVGAVGFLFQAALFQVIGIWLKLLPPSTVVLLAGEAAVFLNYALHERFSFADRRSTDSFARKFPRFQALSACSFLTQWVFVHTAERLFPHQAVYLWAAYLIGIGVGLMIIYTGSFFWVWGKGIRRHGEAQAG